MLYAIRFVDRPDRLETRRAQLAAHLEWLDRHRDRVLVAGSLRHDPAADPVGGLWIVEAASRDEADAIFRTDPFWVHGLRERYDLWFWSKAFPDRRVPV